MRISRYNYDASISDIIWSYKNSLYSIYIFFLFLDFHSYDIFCTGNLIKLYIPQNRNQPAEGKKPTENMTTELSSEVSSHSITGLRTLVTPNYLMEYKEVLIVIQISYHSEISKRRKEACKKSTRYLTLM